MHMYNNMGCTCMCLDLYGDVYSASSAALVAQLVRTPAYNTVCYGFKVHLTLYNNVTALHYSANFVWHF